MIPSAGILCCSDQFCFMVKSKMCHTQHETSIVQLGLVPLRLVLSCNSFTIFRCFVCFPLWHFLTFSTARTFGLTWWCPSQTSIGQLGWPSSPLFGVTSDSVVFSTRPKKKRIKVAGCVFSPASTNSPSNAKLSFQPEHGNPTHFTTDWRLHRFVAILRSWLKGRKMIYRVGFLSFLACLFENAVWIGWLHRPFWLDTTLLCFVSWTSARQGSDTCQDLHEQSWPSSKPSAWQFQEKGHSLGDLPVSGCNPY